jgi:transposase
MSTRRRALRQPRLRPQQPVLERRRLAAASLFAQGLSAAAVARRVGVSRQSAHRWYHAWQAGGVQALRIRGPVGRHRKLSAVQLDQVEQALLQGAGAHGFTNNRWTLEGVAEVIWRLTRVRHHPVQVWRILT